MVGFNGSLALGTVHKGKLDTQGCPFVLEELQDTVGMEEMATCKLNSGFFSKVACVANLA